MHAQGETMGRLLSFATFLIAVFMAQGAVADEQFTIHGHTYTVQIACH